MPRASNIGGPRRLDRLVSTLGIIFVLGAFAAGCGARDDSDATTTDALAQVPTGTWAGDEVILTVTPDGATAEFACAIGDMPGRLSLGAGGQFATDGSYTAYSGGPVSSSDSTEESWPAEYHGRLTDDAHLTLTVVLLRSGETYGPYDLDLGADSSLERCV